MKKCKGGCQMKSGGKTCMKCGCDMEDEEYEKGEKEEKEEMRSGGMACMKCGGKMHKSGGTVSSCMKCGGGKYTFGGKVKWTKKYANGGEVNDCPPGFMKIGNDCVDLKTVMEIIKKIKPFEPSMQYKMPALSDEQLLMDSEVLNAKPRYMGPKMPSISEEELLRASEIPAQGIPRYITPNYIEQINTLKKKVNSQYASGGMIKRADGSYSQRGLWDNIRANAGSGKEPTKQMLEQEKKIKQEMAVGGIVDTGCPPGQMKDLVTGRCVDIPTAQDSTNVMNKAIELKNFYDNAGYKEIRNYPITENIKNILDKDYKDYKQNLINYNTVLLVKKSTNNPGEVINRKANFEDYRKKPIINKPNIIEQRESAYGVLNVDAPYGYYDTRIQPQTIKPFVYSNNDMAEVYMYDPVAVKPYADRTSEEHLEFQQKYGNYGGGSKPYDPTFKPLPVPDPGQMPKEDSPYKTMKDIKYSPEDIEILGKIKGKGLRRSGMWLQLTDADKIAAYKRGSKFEDMPEYDKRGPGYYSFGGAIKSYTDGGKVARTGNKNADLVLTINEMFKAMKADKEKYTGVTAGGLRYYRDENDIPVVEIPDNEIPYDDEGFYSDEMAAEIENRKKRKEGNKGSNTQLYYSSPNLGYAKLEQKKLNELINAEIKAGAKDLELLVEDDIIGPKTLSAMNKFEGKGYTRPEGFKDKWLKKYAEDYANGVRMKVPGVTAPLTPKVPGKETFKTTEIKVEEDQSYTKEDFYSDILNTGKGALEYLFPSIKTAPIKIPKSTLPAEEKSTAKKVKQEQTKGKEESSFFPSMSDIMSGIQGGLTGAVDYGSKALEYITGEGGNYIRSAQAKDKIIKADLARKAEEDRKKRIAYMKSDLNYGLEAAKGFGYDVLGGLGSAYEYATQLGEKGQKQKAEEDRINSYKNFGKKSAKAAAESATERAKKLNVDQGYVPVKINPIIPSINKEKLPLEKSAPSYIKNAKGQMIATDFMKDQKSKNLEKRLDEGSKNFLNIPLRKSNAPEDVRHNSKVVGEHYNKIEKALDMLSGTGPTSKQGFIRMTTIPNRTVDPITRKVSNGFENVEGKEYEELAIIHTFLEKELDKIHADPKYKDLDVYDKKAVLYRKLENTAKKLMQRQNEIKSQIK